MPLWDCHSGWDGRPICVMLEDLDEFLKTQRVRKVRSHWPEGGDLTWDVTRITDDDTGDGNRSGAIA